VVDRGEPEASCSEWHADGTDDEGEAGSEAACICRLSSWRQDGHITVASDSWSDPDG
jgi:hypothetical protein